MSEKLTEKTCVYVSKVTGDDLSAEIDNEHKPFFTINNALRAVQGVKYLEIEFPFRKLFNPRNWLRIISVKSMNKSIFPWKWRFVELVLTEKFFPVFETNNIHVILEGDVYSEDVVNIHGDNHVTISGPATGAIIEGRIYDR